MLAQGQPLADGAGGDAGTDREPAAECLGTGDHVGPHRGALVRPERSGPPHPGLDLVEDEQRAGLVAGLAGGDEHLVRDHVDPGFALDRLDHDRRGALADRRPQGRRIVAWNRDEPGGKRTEEVLPGEPGSRGESRQGAAVKGVIEHDDLGPVDPLGMGAPPDELDRALVRLGAGVAEEGPAAERGLDQALGEQHGRLGVKEVGGARQGRDLLADRLDDPRMAVPRVVNGESAEHVQVLAALGIPEARTLAADELDRRPRIRRHRVAPLDAAQVLDAAHGVTIVPIPASVKSSRSRL